MSVTEDDVVPTHHVEIPRSRLDASVSQLASVGWAVEVSGRRYRPAGNVAWNVNSGIDWFELSGSIDFGGVIADMPELLAALARGDRAVDLQEVSRCLNHTSYLSFLLNDQYFETPNLRAKKA